MTDADNKKYALAEGWVIATDPDDQGRADGWFRQIRDEAVPTVVPSIIQQTFPDYHGVAWYWNRFSPRLKKTGTDRVILQFGGADYKADVWLDGEYLGGFEGGETPFAFDVTDVAALEGENLVAVRVLNPTDHDIDGLNITNVPNRNKCMKPWAGNGNNIGGLTYPVDMHVVPNVHITDMFVQSDIHTGRMSVDLTLENASGADMCGTIRVDVVDHGGNGESVASRQFRADFVRGGNEYKAELTVDDPVLWDIDDPHLYRVNVSVETDAGIHGKSVRHGFREFLVRDGFFYLNGRRIFLKSAHTGNAFPVGQMIPTFVKQTREDFVFAKAYGFNCIRNIAGMLRPEQLDLCDEIGLLIYSECFAAWQLGVGKYPIGDEEAMLQRFDNSTSYMIKRDRNHPCVVIWGLLNETLETSVFWRAVRYLPIGRRLDPSRLFLLSSGRFESRFEVGSVSNPGSYAWENVWGDDGMDKPEYRGYDPYAVSMSAPGSGDFHDYPIVPHPPEVVERIRSFGKGTKPVFLSEYGIGSLFHVIDEWRQFEQHHTRPDLEDGAWLAYQANSLIRDWKRFGLESVYPFPEQMLNESYRLSARYRTIGFNLIRSNPNLCGFNLTGLLDHGFSGEGLWSYWRRFKPAMFDAVSDGWSPLRWCLFATPTHAYSGRPFQVEAVLATEHALQPGRYPASFAIVGEQGPVWRQDAEIVIPEDMPFAVPVLKEDVVLDVPTGKYSLIANMNAGGSPTGSKLDFYITNEADYPALDGEAIVWGLKEETNTFLISMGLKFTPFSTESRGGRILVGNPEDIDNEAKWNHLMELAGQGADVLFLNSDLFSGNEARSAKLPIPGGMKVTFIRDWLYHKECIATHSPVFEGLNGAGIVDYDYYDQVYPHNQLEGEALPDDIICPCFYTGSYLYDGSYGAFHNIAAYNYGAGRLILNTFYVEENLGANPAADLMLLNFVKYMRES